jgi:hypothetical protein
MLRILFASLLLTQCAQEDSFLASNEESHALVFLSGGFNSCPSESIIDSVPGGGKTWKIEKAAIEAGFYDMLDDTYGERLHKLYVCFKGPHQLISSLTMHTLALYQFDHPDFNEESPSFGIPQGDLLDSSWCETHQERVQKPTREARADGSPDSQLVHEDPSGLHPFGTRPRCFSHHGLDNLSFLSHLKMEITRLRKTHGTLDMYFLGHSYGGFTAMHLADTFIESVKLLVTFDPISILKCQSQQMATRLDLTLFGLHEGCGEAPTDMYSQEARKRILSEKINWLHYYQESFVWLHSGLTAEG